MRLLPYLLILPLALGELLVIPAVESLVAEELAKFHAYTEYKGPTGTAVAAIAATQLATPEVRVAAAAPYPYWYETITHQGKAAFNTNTAYQVFRNVKTYGAKGYVAKPHLLQYSLILAQRWRDG